MKALDLFAGTGWGVACQQLGISELGVEIMPEAVAVRKRHKLKTLYSDVWEGLRKPSLYPFYDILIASPPCQTFSVAGNGAGVQALSKVVGLIESGKYSQWKRLRSFGDATDPRTALVLTPLTHIQRDMPEYVALEQVPTVLPVWRAYEHELQSLGYHTWSGLLQSEQYGVPQVRQRAVLMASLSHEVNPPIPTHSRYYPRDPYRLDEEVEPWVSVAEAWGISAELWPWMKNGAHSQQNGPQERPTTVPSKTVTSDVGGLKFVSSDTVSDQAIRLFGQQSSAPNPGLVGQPAITVQEASLLQGYPDNFDWQGIRSAFLQLGNAFPPPVAHAVLSSLVSRRFR